jgi:hypothetical protein
MAHYHLHVSPGPKGAGAEHAQYIERGGRFKPERYGEIGEHERGNLPAWAKGSAARFFAAADEHERANGNAYREFELALPVELSDAERGQLVREFVVEQIGDRHAYAWAIHEPRGHNPHVHIMFSERIVDGIERGPEQYFKRANTKNPERGGHAKSDRFTSSRGPEEVQALRARWAEVQNAALERAGVSARVDHRTLGAQGIEREATQHRGPAVSGIEARGKVADVTARREEERSLRHEERRDVVAEIRHVTRDEVAAERVAARERRELAREVTGTDRAMVLPLVEADRREQLGRAQAAAERRVERRLGIGGRLLEQARALRERIGEQLGRVKEWVREHFAEPFREIKERARETITETRAAARQRWLAMRETANKEAPALNLEQVKARGRADWLALRQRAQEEAAAARMPGRSIEPTREPPAATNSPKPGAPEKFDLEQIKAQGRAGLQGLKQELQAEQLRAAQERQQKRERERGRSLGRHLGDDDGPRRGPEDDGDGPRRGRGRGRGRGGGGMER